MNFAPPSFYYLQLNYITHKITRQCFSVSSQNFGKVSGRAPTKRNRHPQGVSVVCVRISSKMNIPSPCALKASFQIFGWGMRTQRPSSPGEIPRTESPKEKITPSKFGWCYFGDPYGNRTHVTAVKGPCLNRLTNGPLMVADVGFEPTTCRV